MKTLLNGCRVSIEAVSKNKRIHTHIHTQVVCLNVTFLYNRKLLFIQTVCCSGENLVYSFTPIVTVVIATASSETTVGPNLGPGAVLSIK